MKALVGAFNQEKALVGAFSVIVQPVVEPMDRFAAIVECDWVVQVIFTLLSTDRWREAVRAVRVTARGVKDTPVKQLIKRFPELAKVQQRLQHFPSSALRNYLTDIPN